MSETRERMVERITEYLSLGGFWNPELMDHAKVRELLIDCRDALAEVKPVSVGEPAPADSVLIPREPTDVIIAAMEKARALAGNEYFAALEDVAERSEARNALLSMSTGTHQEYMMRAAYAAIVKEVTK